MANKKKIAIVVNSCIVGGVETALINMLRLMDADKFDITVFTNFEGNPIVKNVPEYVKCVDLDEYGIKTVYKHAVSTHDLKTVLTILYNYARFRLGKNAYNRNAWLYKHINFKEINYDYLIAYKFGASSIAIANEAFNAKKTLVWIHGDLPINDSEYKSTLASFDKCFCVSEYMKEHFLSHCPTAREKTDVFHNIVDAEDIWNKSKPPVNWWYAQPLEGAFTDLAPERGTESLTPHYHYGQPLQAAVFLCLLILVTRKRVKIFFHAYLI